MSGLEKYQLNNSALTHLAFRVSALNAFDLLKQTAADPTLRDYGYLSELPLTREVAPQVQLDLLSKTWRKGCDAKLYPPTIVDECVLHCTFERCVQLVLTEPHTAKEFLTSGLKPIDPDELTWLPVRMRTLQLTLPLPTSVEAAQTVESVESGRAQGYNGIPVGPVPRDQLFELLGRWQVNRNLAWSFEGLLTTSEMLEMTRFMNSNRSF